MLALTEAGIAAIIGAVLSGFAAVLAGVAAIIAAAGRRVGHGLRAEVSTPNGRTLGESVARIEADLVEHLGTSADQAHPK